MLSNDNAKKFVNKTLVGDVRYTTTYVNNWLSMTEDVKCYMLYINKELISICLISKIDSDPSRKYTDPYMLNFIYTFPKHREENYARTLLRHIKDHEQMIAYGIDKKLNELLESSGFV